LATNLLVAGVCAYLAILAYLYVFQRSILYVPNRTPPALGDLAAVGIRDVTLTTSDGLSLLAWYRPPRMGRPVILYFHGNGGNIEFLTPRAEHFAGKGYGVLFAEYRGYGGNPGSPTEAGLYLDADAALDFLGKQGITADRLVVYGESLGTGVAVHVAARHKVAALILESPFTSVAAAAQYHYPYIPASLLIWDRFDSLAQIGKVKAAILVLSGGQDTIVPPHLTRALFDAAPEPKEMFFVPNAGHINLDAFGGLDAVDSFIARNVR
jgi:hypothetical protein